MANMTNNEKILHVLETYEELKPKLDSYLEILKQRYDWMSKQRADYTELAMNLSTLKTEINRLKRDKGKNQDLYNEALKEVTKVLSEDEELGLVSEQLTALEMMLKSKKYNFNTIEGAKQDVSRQSKLYSILDQLSKVDMIFVADEDLDNFIEYLEYYTKGLRHYRSLSKEDVLSDLKLLLTWCEENEFDGSGLDYMINVIGITEDYPEKMGADLLLDSLHDARTPEAYIRRGHTVLTYYSPLLDSMNNLRRVLRESREFRSVSNAINRYSKSVQNLKEYYQKSYLQAGGMPENTKANVNRYKQNTEKEG